MDLDQIPLADPWRDILRAKMDDPTLGPLAAQVVASFAAFSEALNAGG
jgi:hypothetical protein